MLKNMVELGGKLTTEWVYMCWNKKLYHDWMEDERRVRQCPKYADTLVETE